MKHSDLPICYALFAHTKAAYKNNVWYPVGENTVKSLKHDREQKDFLLKDYDSLIEDELWNHKIKIAIVYFNYMVRETIYFNSGYHMWMFYFRNYIEEIINIIPKKNTYNHEKSTPSFLHFIIEEIFSIMNEWLDLSKDQDNDNRVIDTIRCIGDCLLLLYSANEEKISTKFKINQFNRILSTYFEFSHYPNNIGANTSREWIEKLFKNPKNPDSSDIEITTNQTYIELLKKTWEKFDKVPYKWHEDNGSIKRFKTNVLMPLGVEE